MSEADVIAVSAPQRAAVPTCRYCGVELHRTLVDLATHCPDPAARGRPVVRPATARPSVKVVLFCGGLGLRMGETTARVPKR